MMMMMGSIWNGMETWMGFQERDAAHDDDFIGILSQVCQSRKHDLWKKSCNNPFLLFILFSTTIYQVWIDNGDDAAD